jgi:hypothetical protein
LKREVGSEEVKEGRRENRSLRNARMDDSRSGDRGAEKAGCRSTTDVTFESMAESDSCFNKTV